MLLGSCCLILLDLGAVLRHFEVFDFFFATKTNGSENGHLKTLRPWCENGTSFYAYRVVMNAGVPQNNSYVHNKQPPEV